MRAAGWGEAVDAEVKHAGGEEGDESKEGGEVGLDEVVGGGPGLRRRMATSAEVRRLEGRQRQRLARRARSSGSSRNAAAPMQVSSLG